jgi:hypothetical protein
MYHRSRTGSIRHLLQFGGCVYLYSGSYEELYLLGFNAVWSLGSQPTFRRNISKLGLPPPFTLASVSTYSTLMMEAICSSERSIDFQWTIRRYIPEESPLLVSIQLVQANIVLIQSRFRGVSIDGVGLANGLIDHLYTRIGTTSTYNYR